ncbi:unnamed protein product [Calypogeia fissa]
MSRQALQYSLVEGRDPIIKQIKEKVAQFTLIRVDHVGDLYVLHYEVGQKYDPHFDYFHDAFSTLNGDRVIMYLSDVEAGAKTVCVSSCKVEQQNTRSEGTECAKAGLAVRPQKRMGLLFWNLDPDTEKDLLNLMVCPVIEGDKWSATKWLHIEKYSVLQQLSWFTSVFPGGAQLSASF